MSADSSERRSSPRFAVELRVEFRHLGRPQESFAEIAKNLSTGGIFVETSVGIPLGSQVVLEIAPSRSAKPITVHAEVVRVEEEPGTVGSKAVARTKGLGMRFLASDAAEVARLFALAKGLSERSP